MLTKEQITNSLKYVVENSRYVSIDFGQLEALVKNFVPTETIEWNKVYSLEYKPRANIQDEIDFLFLLGNQAFCYWGYPAKWTIDVGGKKIDGFFANIAAFDEALKNGVPLLEGEFLADLNIENLRVLYGGHPEIPLLKERCGILKSIGKTLVAKYRGRFHNFLQAGEQSIFNLMEKMAEEFAGFNDTASYKGKEIFFYKKLNLILHDIAKIVEKINGAETLPGTADYKIPAILRTKGILKYNEALSKKVDNRVEIPSGSEMEVEIRANMLWVCNEIVDKLKNRGIEISPMDFENALWIESQDKTKFDKPYHLTKTVFY